MTADSSKSRTFILCEKKHLQTKRKFGTVAVTWGSFSLWGRQGKALRGLHFIVSSLYRLCLSGENVLRARMPVVVCVYNVTSALYCAINNHFCVIRVPFVATSRLARRRMCDSPQRGVRDDLLPHICGANKRRLKPIFM